MGILYLAILAAPPLAFMTSLVGAIVDESKKYAVAGLVLSALTMGLFVVLLVRVLLRI